MIGGFSSSGSARSRLSNQPRSAKAHPLGPPSCGRGKASNPASGFGHPLPQEGGVDSTLKCNGIEVEEYFVGGEVAETFARPLIEQVLDGLKFLDGDGAEVARTREKLAEQAVEVLVATPLPRAVGVSEVNLGVKRVLQPAVLGKLGTAVAGQGVALLDERIQAVPDAG